MSEGLKKFLKILSMCICVIPPLVSVLMCFPIWIEQGSSKTVSGLCLLISFLCMLPFVKQIKEYFKSPSVIVLWVVICIVMTLIRNIIDQILLVSYVALISNAVGMLIYKLSQSKKKE